MSPVFALSNIKVAKVSPLCTRLELLTCKIAPLDTKYGLPNLNIILLLLISMILPESKEKTFC